MVLYLVNWFWKKLWTGYVCQHSSSKMVKLVWRWVRWWCVQPFLTTWKIWICVMVSVRPASWLCVCVAKTLTLSLQISWTPQLGWMSNFARWYTFSFIPLSVTDSSVRQFLLKIVCSNPVKLKLCMIVDYVKQMKKNISLFSIFAHVQGDNWHYLPFEKDFNTAFFSDTAKDRSFRLCLIITLLGV